VDDVIAKLRAALVAGPRLRLAVLFGSQATGRARAESDVDVGIIPSAPMSLAEELALAATLSKAVGAQVDLVRLDRDEPLVGREAALHGKPIFEERAGVFAAFRADAVSAWIDFDETVSPHRRRFLERLAERR
jgi:predicted nucleotidyltransferase